MLNQKQGLTDSVSCPTMEIPDNIILRVRSKRETSVEPRWAKQQTRSSGPNQLKWIALSRGHHRV